MKDENLRLEAMEKTRAEVTEVMKEINEVITGRSLTVAINATTFVLSSAIMEIENEDDLRALVEYVQNVVLYGARMAQNRIDAGQSVGLEVPRTIQ